MLTAFFVWLARCPHADQPSLIRNLATVEAWISETHLVLEIASSPQEIDRGLSGRSHLPQGRGMIFVFPAPTIEGFVMRDCPFPLDIIFLDEDATILAAGSMTPEQPRGPKESVEEYEARLKIFLSPPSTSFAIELSPGSVNLRILNPGSQVHIDLSALRARTTQKS